MPSQSDPARDSLRTHTAKVRKARRQVVWRLEETVQCVEAINDKGACEKYSRLPRSGVDLSRSRLQNQDVAGGHLISHPYNLWRLRVRHKPNSQSPNCLLRCSRHWHLTGETAMQVQHSDPIPLRVRSLPLRRLSLLMQSLAQWWANGCGNTCASANRLE